MDKLEWPVNGDPLMFEDLCASIRRAIEFAYRLKVKNLSEGIPWDGPELDLEDEYFDNPSKKLTGDYLRWAKKERKIDALDTIIAIALQIGMEQGRRSSLENFREAIERGDKSI